MTSSVGWPGRNIRESVDTLEGGSRVPSLRSVIQQKHWAKYCIDSQLYSTRPGMRLSILVPGHQPWNTLHWRLLPPATLLARQEPRNKDINPHRVKYKSIGNLQFAFRVMIGFQYHDV